MTFVENIEAWHWWILLGLLLAIGEVLGAHFVLLGLGLSTVAAALVSVTDGTVNQQFLAWGITSAIVVPTLVLYFRRQQRQRPQTSLEEGWMVGMKVRTEEYGGRIGVRLKGDFYPARLSADGSVPDSDCPVEVVGMQGITVLVHPLGETTEKAAA